MDTTSTTKVVITGTGIVCPVGIGCEQTLAALKADKKGVAPLTVFPAAVPLPVGEITGLDWNSAIVPRTHLIAQTAAAEAMEGINAPPDAVIVGITTGGMEKTENLLLHKEDRPEEYKYHSTGSVAVFVAEQTGCKGPALTISTACSSGSAAIMLGLSMIRSGRFKRVLAGGADSICRLTYYGFNSLQLIDPTGAKPFCRNRKGMSVAEGAGFVLLQGVDGETPENTMAELAGGGLTCDAYHPAAPHPQGAGALSAMDSAMQDAHVDLESIDYISLHGTGTFDNDLAESRAVAALFAKDSVDPPSIPDSSSIKGATGHSLAASGAMEAVIAVMGIVNSFIPANISDPDSNSETEIQISPIQKPVKKEVKAVLSNSFGFGGNNASLVITKPGFAGTQEQSEKPAQQNRRFTVAGTCCLTAAGVGNTAKQIAQNKTLAGCLDSKALAEGLPNREIRRLKRLPRMVLRLVKGAIENTSVLSASPDEDTASSIIPQSIFFGTGFGPLSETYDFMTKLFESDEQFTSPTDFVGSVHNAPAGQAAIKYGAKGPNITATCRYAPFEQALLSAQYLADDAPFLVVCADEYHDALSPLFDPPHDPGSHASDGVASDGGAAFIMESGKGGTGLECRYYGTDFKALVDCVKRDENNHSPKKPGAIMVAYPGITRKAGESLLEDFLEQTSLACPIIDYKRLCGEHASASAVAAGISMELLSKGILPGSLINGDNMDMTGKSILILNLGRVLTLTEAG